MWLLQYKLYLVIGGLSVYEGLGGRTGETGGSCVGGFVGAGTGTPYEELGSR